MLRSPLSATWSSVLPFVGRAPLLRSLERELAACAAGRGALLLLCGEAGIGKTRTAEELAQRAAARGFAVVRSRCPEVAGAPALWPWQQVLRQLLAEDGAGTAPGRLRALLEPAAAPFRLHERAEAERFGLFRELIEFLLARARRGPLLILLDDVHRADRASLSLLQELASDLGEASLCLVANWRDTELAEGPLGAALPALARHARTTRLHGLARGAVAELAATISQQEPAPAVVRALHERSEGNPLFVRHLAELLVVEGADLSREETAGRIHALAPRGVQDVIRDRLARLPTALRHFLRVAAALGRDVRPDLLAAAWKALDGGTAEPELDRALDACVLRPAADAGSLEFAHVLLRDVLYHELSVGDRRRVHRAIAEAIVDGRDLEHDAWLTAAAHHFVEAGPSREAVDYATRAGARAMARHGNEDAVRWFEAALACLARLPLLASRDERALLLRQLGDARWRSGAQQTARRAFLEAFEIARDVGDAETMAASAIGLAGRTDATLGPEEESARRLETALEALGPEPTRERAEALARFTSALYFSDDAAARERASREAVACAEAVGDPATVAYALTARHFVLYRPGTLEERLRVARRTLEEALRGEDPNTTALARFHLVLNGLESGDFALADEHLAAYGALAERLRQPFLLWQQRAFAATRVLVEGRLAEAEQLAGEALALGRRAGSDNAPALFAAQLYAIRREQGRLGELEPTLADLCREFPRMPAFAFARAEAMLALGAAAEAQAFLRAAASADGALALPHDLNWGAAASTAARVCVALGDVGHGERLYEEILPLSGTCFVLGFANVWDGAVDLALGELATLLGRLTEARAHLAEAARLHARVGARPHLVRTWLAQADLCRRREDRDGTRHSRVLARQALDVACALGLAAAVTRARALLGSDGQPDRSGPPQAAGPTPGRFVRRGGRWQIGFAGREGVFPSSRGMVYLAELLARPNEPIHVLDLAALVAPPGAPPMGGADAGELLDARARRAVRSRMHDLARALEEAERNGDPARRDVLRHELEALERTLASALGLGGRARRAGDPVERARKAVYNRIGDAVRRIEAELPELGRHLRRGVKTGRTCTYAPEHCPTWELGPAG